MPYCAAVAETIYLVAELNQMLFINLYFRLLHFLVESHDISAGLRSPTMAPSNNTRNAAMRIDWPPDNQVGLFMMG